ncbi:hypothetical protein [Dyella koreensis]|uniref:Uncharacterized protein n=1 Tax=Dyella koreensis TaxID=311235 RepID=A0ABW8K6T3_9GAMM
MITKEWCSYLPAGQVRLPTQSLFRYFPFRMAGWTSRERLSLYTARSSFDAFHDTFISWHRFTRISRI